MNHYSAYIRVSTARQGERGVSLQEQQHAIERYCQSHGLTISRWFEERETAAKRGRPIFGQMLAQLRRGKGRGVVLHKIDRGARNLKDWADLGELIDLGIEVHFANESLDLQSRGGRLSADIQAVVAADYIRNLREETRKGFFGRLKQGLLPMPAPVGYRNVGSGSPKEIDPNSGPLVRELFSLYATGTLNFAGLLQRARDMGLHGRSGRPLTKNGLSTILNNPFYMGIIHIQKTHETFAGAHTPLISKALFDRVQDILRGKTNTRAIRHDFLFRRRLVCKACGRTLIGETHRSFVYYRCQTRTCPTTAIREEAVETALLEKLTQLQLSKDEQRWCSAWVARHQQDAVKHREEAVQSVKLRLSQLEDRLSRLTDAYLDRAIEREIFEQRKTALLAERCSLQNSLDEWMHGCRDPFGDFETFLEQANGASSAYQLADLAQKRELIDTVTSNRFLNGKSLEITLALPFNILAEREKSTCGSPRRDTGRTCQHILSDLEQRAYTTVLRSREKAQP